MRGEVTTRRFTIWEGPALPAAVAEVQPAVPRPVVDPLSREGERLQEMPTPALDLLPSPPLLLQCEALASLWGQTGELEKDCVVGDGRGGVAWGCAVADQNAVSGGVLRDQRRGVWLATLYINVRGGGGWTGPDFKPEVGVHPGGSILSFGE